MLSGSGPSPSSTRSDARKDIPLMSRLALPPHLHREVIRRRVVEGNGKNRKNKNDHVIRNFISVVTALERWWWQAYEEKRRMETLTPVELDNYLCEFYTVLKKPSGKDYDPKSFRAFPTTLDSFLKERNYPVSIQKSPLFCRSQLAYRTRLRKLREAAELRERTIKSAMTGTPTHQPSPWGAKLVCFDDDLSLRETSFFKENIGFSRSPCRMIWNMGYTPTSTIYLVFKFPPVTHSHVMLSRSCVQVMVVHRFWWSASLHDRLVRRTVVSEDPEFVLGSVVPRAESVHLSILPRIRFCPWSTWTGNVVVVRQAVVETNNNKL